MQPKNQTITRKINNNENNSKDISKPINLINALNISSFFTVFKIGKSNLKKKRKEYLKVIPGKRN